MSWRVRSWLPDWAVVMVVSAVVGAISAVLSVYREAVVEGNEALPVPSQSDDGTN